MTQSNFLTQEEKKSNSSLYEPKQSLSDIQSYRSIITDQSLDFLKQVSESKIPQRFVGNGIINKKEKTITWILTPTIIKLENYKEHFSSNIKLLGLEKFAIVPVDAPSGLGVAHSLGAEKALNDPQFPQKIDPKELGNQLGISLIFKPPGNITIHDRSTLNWNVFEINKLAHACFMFDDLSTLSVLNPQTSTSLGYDLRRSLSSSFLQSSFCSLLLQNCPEIKNLNLPSYKYEKIWRNIQDNPEELAYYLMKSIYIASGLKRHASEQKVVGHIPPSSTIIADILQLAKENNITLNLEWIPSDFSPAQTKGATALMHAIRNKDLETTELLLKHGAKLDVLDNSGDSPLFLAILLCDANMVKLLFRHGLKLENLSLEDSKIIQKNPQLELFFNSLASRESLKPSQSNQFFKEPTKSVKDDLSTVTSSKKRLLDP